mgnify:CR=1 FL=1
MSDMVSRSEGESPASLGPTNSTNPTRELGRDTNFSTTGPIYSAIVPLFFKKTW